ncbi:MAG TPA: serine hydrolase domain-containing protein [Planctomycetaceae bacterium]|jgi:CubicO group peptidase (beta-lactamase class C family)|nr:serine hydrolase domain-containing protein [Planctomycetaceae bacterium]
MEEPVIATSQEISRRAALMTGAALFGWGLTGSSARSAEAPRVDPFHDPTYSLLRTREDLVKHLRDEAREAQEKPRAVNGISVTGLPVAVSELDDTVTKILRESGIPGAAVCIAKNDRLVCTRGYGRASLVGNVPVEPTMPATIMSVSKPLTVTAALMLVRDGKLRLDDLAFQILKDGPLLAPGQSVDPRQNKITIQQLMSHTSGLFNAVEILNDPARFRALAQRGHIQLIHKKIAQNDLIRVGMGQKLLFAPGRKFAYSGQGMQVLARVVEKLSGWRLDRYIRRFVFAPLGVRSYCVGSYLSESQYRQFLRPNREQFYAMCPAMYNKDQNRHHVQDLTNVPYLSWGGADACGWGVVSAIDLLRWVTYFFKLVGPELAKASTEQPWVVNDKGERVQGGMGLGWIPLKNSRGGPPGITHEGGWPGEGSLAERRANGASLAALVNSDDVPHVKQIYSAARRFVSKLRAAPAGSPEWKDYGFAEAAFSG